MNTTSPTEERKGLSVEELLLPRYKVIADYPRNIYFKVGEIVVLTELDDREHIQPERYVRQHSIHSTAGNHDYVGYYENDFNRYPHLFRKLEWWEDRDIEDMPEYMKIKHNGKVFKSYGWNKGLDSRIWYCKTQEQKETWAPIDLLDFSTLAEYESQNKQS